ncbi:MAG: isoprenylcysteine carboxyl methyltransferase family protein [Myxococcales bacterium]
MVTSVESYLALIGLVACQRLVELRLSRANLRKALARGAVEYGRGHFPVMAALHGAFLCSCALEVVLWHRPFPGAVGWGALAAFVLAQGLRYWAIASLGDRWNVRVIVVPGEALIVRGPYRYVRHPNYLAVAIELATLPLIHGAYLTAIVFSAMNAALLRVRIRTEQAALGCLAGSGRA